MKNKNGFTLIETLIYIALFSILMSGAVVTSYALIESTGKIDTKSTVEEEGSFVLKKIDWAMSDTSSISTIITPASGSYGSSLSLNRGDGNKVEIKINSANKTIEIREGGIGSFIPITTNNVNVSALNFYHIPAIGNSREGIEASTTINGTVFYTKKYFRK